MTNVKNTVKTVAFALAAVIAIAMPTAAEANAFSNTTSLVSNSSNNAVVVTDGNTSGNGNATINTGNFGSSGTISQSVCAVTASDTEINYGESVTFSWNSNQFNSLTINGTNVAGSNGSYTVSNITQNRIFQIAGFDKNGSPCAAQIIIVCNPLPIDCRLDITKTVDRNSAKPGDELTYTIRVKNVGTTDCTGSGPKIVDEIDSNIEYLRHSLTGDFRPGYSTGSVSYDVYESGSHTLYFTGGDVLTPGESGTITWVGRVLTPTQCGDFTVENQARATAYELNNFLSWKYSNTVVTAIDYDCPNPTVPSCDSFTASPSSLMVGNSATLTWNTSNATRVSINNGIGNVGANGALTVTPLQTTTYTLSVFDGNNQVKDTCAATVTVTNNPAPSCDLFESNPSTIVRGSSATLTWETSNANTVLLNNGIGAVVADGSRTVTPTSDTTYVLTVIGAQDQSVDCSVTVRVSEDPVPVCKSFSASPATLPVGGGNVTLNWDVEKASSVSITPIVGSVALTDSTVVNVTQSTTFILTATDTNGDETTCSAPVAVADPAVFTCEANVSFDASDTSIDRGDDIVLNWNVTGADSVSITDIGTVSLTGSQTVSPNSDTTYTLTATKNNQTINCPVSIDVDSGGGGGGGSSSPRCELEISDTRISRGEEITLEWDSTRARELEIVDDRGNVLVTTDDLLNRDKDDLFEGEITLRPTRDTEYTLTVERGSRDRVCRVEVEVEDGQVLGVVRDQQPLVAGIALSQVPYTGFEAGPVLTLMFYMLLMAWALYVAYFIAIRKRNTQVPASHFASTSDLNVLPGGATTSGSETMKKAEDTRPDVFAASSVATKETETSTPENLPTGNANVGYESYFAGASVSESKADEVVTELENRAHAQKALLSSDAITYFMRSTEGALDRNEALDTVITDAKKDYPLEDGWIVINQVRMEQLLDATPKQSPEVGASLPAGTGSLAEAIVTGNVVAAYDMIGNRPMFALAEAAADLDSVVRNRKGDTSPISDLLKKETENISDEQLQTMISALTGAIDGTYSDEASAVKMAIMKAVKEVA